MQVHPIHILEVKLIIDLAFEIMNATQRARFAERLEAAAQDAAALRSGLRQLPGGIQGGHGVQAAS